MDGPMNFGDSNEHRQLVELVVSGKLKGELPDGFLSQFRSLPNEILQMILSYLPDKELRKFRLVSKQWNSLCLLLKRTIIIRGLELKENDNMVYANIYLHDNSVPRDALINKDEVSVSNFFSFFKITDADGLFPCFLILESGMANSYFFRLFALQNWRFPGIIFRGEQLSLTEEDLIGFFKDVCARTPDQISVIFEDVELGDAVITDRVIEVLANRIEAFVVTIPDQNLEKKSLIITDRSLKYLIRCGVTAVLPFCPDITINGIKNAIQVLMVHSFFTSIIYFGVTSNVTAGTVREIEIVREDCRVDVYNAPLPFPFSEQTDRNDLGSTCFSMRNKDDGLFLNHCTVVVASQEEMRCVTDHYDMRYVPNDFDE